MSCRTSPLLQLHDARAALQLGVAGGVLRESHARHRLLKKNRATIEACGQSMLNRGGELGFAQYDSSRCEEAQRSRRTIRSITRWRRRETTSTWL
jgi:hypothetical protein